MRTPQKGFTLIELAVVIAIVAILAAVAIPRFGSTTASAECSMIKDMASQMTSAASIFTAENARTPNGFEFVTNAAMPANPVAGSPTLSLMNFGTNSGNGQRCGNGGAGVMNIACNGPFNSYNATYTYNNGVVTWTATARNGAQPCR